MKGKNIGFAVCGSFCNFKNAEKQLRELVKYGATVRCILSENTRSIDTRFGRAEDWYEKFKEISGTEPIVSIVDAEPIGPKKMFDVLILCPCTGNTLAKLSNGITDSTVTMAVKSHLRGARPVVVALSTNDGLGATMQNFSKLLNTKHYYFVPLLQDDPYRKPNSLVCDYQKLTATAEAAMSGTQIKPLFEL